MECNVTNPANGKKSELHEQFLTIFDTPQEAEVAYAKVLGNSFAERFGDWGYSYKNPEASDKEIYFKNKGITYDEAMASSKETADSIREDIKNFRRLGKTDPKTGEPLLMKDLKNNMWFFLDKNGVRDYISKMNLSEFTAQQIKEVTNHFLYRFALENEKKSFNYYDPSELEEGRITASIRQSIKAYRESIKDRENEAVLSERIDLVEKNIVGFKDELISYIEGLGLSVRERITDAEGNPVTEVAEKDKGGGLNIQESFEVNSKNTATVNTKIFLSQIEERVFVDQLDENGKKTGERESVPVQDGYLEKESFAKFDDVWNTLNKMLVDEVGYTEGENVIDIFDVMYDKLYDHSDTKLWIHDLLDKLDSYRDSKNTNKITEFVQAFSKTSINYFVTQVDNGEYTVINATFTNSRQSQITNKWNNSFQDRYLNDKGVLEDREREIIKKAHNDIKGFFEKWKNDKKRVEAAAEKNTEEGDEESIDILYDAAGEQAENLISIMNKLGATDINTDDVNRMVIMNGGDKKMSQTIDNLHKSTEYMINSILKKDFKFVSKEGMYENIFNREIFTKAFAEAVGFRMTDMSDSSVLLNQGKSGYTVSNPTYVSNKINEWKKNPKELEDMMQEVSKKNSDWLSFLLALDIDEGVKRNEKREERLDSFKVGLDSSFTSKGKNDGVSNTEITTNDQINANLSQMLNDKLSPSNKSYFPTIIAADKSRRMLFEGPPSFTSNIQKIDGETYISPRAINMATGYFIDEYNRMKRVNRENNDEDIDKVVHYHGENGNGLKSQIFPEFNKDSTDPEFKELRAAIYGETFSEGKYEGEEFSAGQLNIVKKFIKKSLTDRVQEHEQTLQGIAGVNKKLLEFYGGDYTALAGDYFMNGLISSVEYTKLFSGDPAYYKNGADLIKRMPATYTDGLPLRLSSNDSLIFNQATVEGVEVASRYVDKILASVKDKSIALAYGRTVDEKGNPTGSNVNTTDAQAWITPRRWRFIKQALGQWGPQHDKVYNIMINGGTMSPEQNKLAAQPLKGVYFEINDGRPVYLKYSQAVLIPSLIKGTPMEALYNKMTKDPKTGLQYGDKEAHLEVHEVVTIDGVKVGAVAPTRINKEGTTEMLSEEDIVLNPKILSNRGWKLQQDLPVKLMKETNVGSQIQKNIFEGMSMEGDYNFEGGMKGRKLAQKIHDTVSKLSNIGKEELKRKYGIGADNRIKDTDLIYETLISEFKDRGGNENIVTALQKREKFDAIPQIRGKVESIFMSIMNRKLTKINTQGGSFIQVSPFGLETIAKSGSGITVVSEDYNNEALLPPRIEKGKVLPGQAMIPHSQAVKILKKHNINFSNLSMEEAMAMLDPSALEMITYRIPNQGMSSNDYLQIVGILPPGMGDSIIVYDGLPAKTGSDFDIDKLFAMQNNLVFNSKERRLTKLTEENKHLAVKSLMKPAYVNKEGEKIAAVPEVMYSDIEIDKMLTQNDLVGQYKSVLNAPQTYDAMMRSIDGAQLKDDIAGNKKEGIVGLFEAPVMKNMELFSPLTQLKTKSEYLSGKMGVGQTANHLVDHVMNQSLNVRLTKWIGVGNKREETIGDKKRTITFFDSETTGEHSIADNLSAFLNAYVDIAKDPYIARANHNSVTANTTFMLLRAGADIKWVNRFIGQPILKELVELQIEQKSITAESIMTKDESGESRASAMDRILKNYGFDPIPKVVTGSTVEALKQGELEDNIRNRDKGSQMEYEILKAWSMLQEQGKIFGDAVIAAKSDTAGAGGSNIDRMVNSNKIKKIYKDENIQGYEAKFKGTMLGTYQENTLTWVKDIIRSSDLFLSGTLAAENIFNAVSFQTANGEFLTDAKLGKEIDNSFYSYIMSGTNLFKDNYAKYDYLTTKVPQEVKKRQQLILDGKKERNFLIEELELQTRGKKTYIGINNKDKPTHYQNEIYRAWMKLYNRYLYNEDGSLNMKDVHPDRKLATDLAKYAFTGSGFQNNLTQFFTHIPHQILSDSNMGGNIRESIDNVEEMTTDSNFVDQFQRHSKDNPKIVKTLVVKSMEGDGLTFIYKPAKNKSQEFGSVANNSRFFPNFVNGKVSVFNPISQSVEISNYLFEKQGTVKREDANGEMISVPVYSRTFELGSSEGKYRTFEYSKGNNLKKSNVSKNNVSQLSKVKIQERMDKIMKENEFKDNSGKIIDQIMVERMVEQRVSDTYTVSSNLAQIIEDQKIKCK